MEQVNYLSLFNVLQAAGLIIPCVLGGSRITVGGRTERQPEDVWKVQIIPGEVYPVDGWRVHKWPVSNKCQQKARSSSG